MLNDIQTALREFKGDPALVITGDTTFAQLNLDSLETVDLVMKLEDIFGVAIEMDGDTDTIAELIATIEQAQADNA
ncbi:MAG: phosphopantetheine-binding protein [Propionibacteriaceae bacterium]|jgi:acyl carrier protein|nr:phosphopantetheine-binding protein [Propionibacteriaceae bacterium]